MKSHWHQPKPHILQNTENRPKSNWCVGSVSTCSLNNVDLESSHLAVIPYFAIPSMKLLRCAKIFCYMARTFVWSVKTFSVPAVNLFTIVLPCNVNTQLTFRDYGSTIRLSHPCLKSSALDINRVGTDATLNHPLLWIIWPRSLLFAFDSHSLESNYSTIKAHDHEDKVWTNACKS